MHANSAPKLLLLNLEWQGGGQGPPRAVEPMIMVRGKSVKKSVGRERFCEQGEGRQYLLSWVSRKTYC